LQWEQANSPWELPTYIGNFAWDLQDMKVWIATGGVAESITMEPTATAPPTNPRPLAARNGESKVGASD